MTFGYDFDLKNYESILWNSG